MVYNMPNFLLVIEHLEPCLNKWILSEYRFVSKIFESKVIFTNVKNEDHRKILSQYGEVYENSVVDILKNNNNVIVLDPKASKEIDKIELSQAEYVVLGGIMGAHPPRGRTWIYITSKLPHSKPRNIGPYQYTIAGAAYVLKRIELGEKVQDIKFVYGLTVKKFLQNNIEVEVYLPYAFPLDNYGNPILPDDYINTVAEYVVIYEARILAGTKDSIC